MSSQSQITNHFRTNMHWRQASGHHSWETAYQELNIIEQNEKDLKKKSNLLKRNEKELSCKLLVTFYENKTNKKEEGKISRCKSEKAHNKLEEERIGEIIQNVVQ